MIGDCRAQHFAKASSDDREIVTDFLDRDDVLVKNWYRKRPTPAEAHLKVWVAQTEEGPAALVGSANLTGVGLFRNWEMVTEASASDLRRIAREIDSLVEQAWDCKARVLGHVSGPKTGQVPRPKTSLTPRQKTSPAPRRKARPAKAKPRGCLQELLQLTGWATILLTATVALVRLIGG